MGNKRSYHLIMKGLMTGSIMAGAVLGTATGAYAAEKTVRVEVSNTFPQIHYVPSKAFEKTQSEAILRDLKSWNEVFEDDIEKGELAPYLFDGLNARMTYLMKELTEIDYLAEYAISEVEVVSKLLEIEHYTDASRPVMAKREESVKILEKLQNKLGITPSKHVLPDLKLGTVQVAVDGEPHYLSQPTALVEGYTLFPMRELFEAVGATLKWDEAAETVTATKDDTTIVFTVGSRRTIVNGTVVYLASKVFVVNDSLMVQLNSIAEAFGSKVDWDAATQTATITSQGGATVTATSPVNKSYIVRGIDATVTKGRIYASKNQEEYDAVVKIAQDALAKTANIQIPKAMQDFFDGKRSNGANTIYNLELAGYEHQLSPLLNAGVSKETLIKDYRVMKAIGQAFVGGSETINERGVESAYDSLVRVKRDCDSTSQAQSLFYDLAGFNTAIVASMHNSGITGFGHADFIVKLDNQWTKLGTPIGTDAQAYLKTVTGGYWMVAPN